LKIRFFRKSVQAIFSIFKKFKKLKTMKKASIKMLTLNKKSVSNLQADAVSGGFDRRTLTFFNGICQCPAPSRDTASWCRCK